MDADDTVERILKFLRRYSLIRTELEWHRRHEPDEYAKLCQMLREAITGGDHR